jgi:hypothetical protein
MHLMALADTVATCKLNICDRFAIDAAKAAMSRDNPTNNAGGEPTPGKIIIKELVYIFNLSK